MTNIGNKRVMAKNLHYYIERSGRSQKEVAEVVGVAPSTFNAWMKGKKYPRIDKIEMLADYFRILKSDLIEEKSDEYREIQRENDALADVVHRMRNDRKFFDAVKALNELEPEKLESLLALLK